MIPLLGILSSRLRQLGEGIAGKALRSANPRPGEAQVPAVGAIRDWAGRRLVRGALLAGFLLLCLSGAVAIIRGDLAVLFTDLLLYAAILGLVLIPGIPSGLRNFLLLGLAYAYGAILLFLGGPAGSADIWLFAGAVLAVILHGPKGAVFGPLLSGSLFLLAIAQQALGLASWNYEVAWLVVLALNLGILSFIVNAALAELLGGLREAIETRERLAEELRHRGLELEREASSRRCAEELVAFYRDFDSLTRLPNRDKFAFELARAVSAAERRGRYVAILAVGFDRWKRLVEGRGLPAAESVLVQAASSLRAAFRDDDLVARGGEELFLLLCSDVKDAEDAIALIGKSQAALEGPFDARGEEIRTSASVGVAIYPNDGVRAEALIAAADAAFRMARDAGPAAYRLFDARLHSELLERVRLEEELEAAVRSDAFEPWFQPRVDRFGRVVSAEALARWVQPDGSIREPAAFVAAAERSGDIEGLGRIILGKACESAQSWAVAGLPPIPVSVNLSPYQFRSPSLIRDVREALRDSGLAPWRLELEITESGLAGDEKDTMDCLAEFKALGIAVSIDDFGTGYSSISKLRDFPIDTVKMPKEFVDRLPGDPRSSMIVQAIIELAHNLRFEVVAEGVESRAQFSWLDGARCDQYQGYLFAPALPRRRFEAALAEGFATVVQ